MTKFKRLVAQFKYLLADRAEMIARLEKGGQILRQEAHTNDELRARLAAKHDAMISASERSERLAGDLRDMTAERDALQAKLDRMTARGSNGKFGGKTS